MYLCNNNSQTFQGYRINLFFSRSNLGPSNNKIGGPAHNYGGGGGGGQDLVGNFNTISKYWHFIWVYNVCQSTHLGVG